MEKARSMLSSASLEQKFWDEVVSITCYLQHRAPTSALVDKMPMKAWSGKKPSLRHTWVFGCDEYAYVLDVNRLSCIKNLLSVSLLAMTWDWKDTSFGIQWLRRYCTTEV